MIAPGLARKTCSVEVCRQSQYAASSVPRICHCLTCRDGDACQRLPGRPDFRLHFARLIYLLGEHRRGDRGPLVSEYRLFNQDLIDEARSENGASPPVGPRAAGRRNPDRSGNRRQNDRGIGGPTTRRQRRAMSWGLMLLPVLAASAMAIAGDEPPRSRTFRLTYCATVRGIPAGYQRGDTSPGRSRAVPTLEATRGFLLS